MIEWSLALIKNVYSDNKPHLMCVNYFSERKSVVIAQHAFGCSSKIYEREEKIKIIFLIARIMVYPVQP